MKSEVTEIYRKIIKAEYYGYEFFVADEKDNNVLIYIMNGNYKEWIRLGMEVIDKGVYEKWVERKDTIIKTIKEYI